LRVSFNVRNKQRQSSSDVGPTDNSPLTIHTLPPFESRRTDFRQHKKSVHARKPTEFFRNYAFGVQDPRVAPVSHGLDQGPPYRSWAQHLARNFNLQLYNEFRRLAIDDLFTRHNNYGVNALTSFYQTCLSSPLPLPDQVIQDMVNLSHAPFKSWAPFKDYHNVIYDLLCSAMWGETMESENRKKAGYFFNSEFGRDKRRWKESRLSR